MIHAMRLPSLIIISVLLILPCETAFSQDTVGSIERIGGTIYWKPSSRAKQRTLNSKLDLHRPLHGGERFRCGPNGLLVMMVHGRRIRLREQMGWYPIPYALNRKRNPTRQIDEGSGSTGGREARRIIREPEESTTASRRRSRRSGEEATANSNDDEYFGDPTSTGTGRSRRRARRRHAHYNLAAPPRFD